MRYYRNYGAKNINLAPIDDLVKVLPTQEQTGKIVTFDSPFAGLPLKSCKVNIPVTQEGTGDPSPDNVRNFVGIDSLDFSATDRNIFPTSSVFPYTNSFNNVYYCDFATGIESRKIPTIHLKEGVEYTLSFDITVDNEPFNISVGAGSGAFSRDMKTVTGLSSGRRSITFTPTASDLQRGDILAFRCPRYGSAQSFVFTIDNVQLEIGGLTDYQPFGDNKLFDFGQTIYAGELDVLTGIFTATHGVVDLGARIWYRNNDGYFFCEGIPIIKTGYANYTPAPMMCENLKTVAFYISSKGGYFEGQDKAIAYGYNSGDRIYAHNTDYTNVSDFTNSMNGIKLVYELATPEVINLGGMEISTLQGENNLFASTGETTVQYFKK